MRSNPCASSDIYLGPRKVKVEIHEERKPGIWPSLVEHNSEWERDEEWLISRGEWYSPLSYDRLVSTLAMRVNDLINDFLSEWGLDEEETREWTTIINLKVFTQSSWSVWRCIFSIDHRCNYLKILHNSHLLAASIMADERWAMRNAWFFLWYIEHWIRLN